MAPARSLSVLLGLVLSIALAGCGNSGPDVPTHHPTGNHSFNGIVHGGQQPVTGSTIQLYTVGATGDGSAATPLLTQTVTTDAGGNFDITGLYSCTNATQVYITATGGNPGTSSANPNLAMMAALGPCTSITASTFIFIDELTTVAATSALAPYMSSPTAIGSSTTDAASLAAAFTLADELVDTTTGASPGVGVPSGYTVPTAQLNTLADIVAACINSTGGVAGDGSPCGNLFSLTTVGTNPAPTNTLSALMNLADNPTQNTSALFALASSNGPYQPTSTIIPPDFQIRLQPPAASLVLQISPSTITFPATAVSFTAAAQSVTIENSGASTVTLNSIALTGSNASDFSISNACGSSLDPGISCTVQVTATPSANGVRNAYLAINSSTSDSPQYVPLSVTGTAPSAGPVTLTSSASFNILGALIDLTLSNTGTTPLNIKSITESDAGQPVYFTIAQTTCGTSLPAQSSCTITVNSSSSPSAGGSVVTAAGTLTVTDDAASGPQTAALSSADSVEIEAPEVLPTNDFTGFVIFPLNQVGYVQTHSTAPLSYSSLLSSTPAPPIPLTLSGAAASDFSVTAQDYPSTGVTNTSCPSTYTPGTSCKITVTFTPTTTGTRTAQLSLDPATGTPTGQYIQLTGSAVGPGPYFVINKSSLSMISYVPSSPDTNSAGMTTLTLTNIGTTTINLAASFTGANPSYMSANVSSCSSVAPEATCSFTVTFSAPTVGNYSANLVLKDTSSSFSLSIPITATTSWWPMNVSPLSLSFGNQAVGTTSTRQYFSVTDINGIPLDHPISVSLQPGSNFTLPDGSSCPASTTDPCQLTVAFAPQAAGSVTEYLTITDETSSAQAQIELTGTGGLPDYTLSTDSVTFPAQSVGTTSAPMTVTLTNMSTHTITVSEVSVAGALNGNFTETNNCSAVLVNGTCSINITFAPSTTGPQSAYVDISSNAVDSVAAISVNGTGQ